MNAIDKSIIYTSVIYVSNDQFEMTIASLSEQSETDLGAVELVLMRSSDYDADEYIDSIKDNFGKVFVSEKKYQNEMEAYCDALSKISGKYVCFMQCGNVYSPLVLSEVTKEFEKFEDEIKLVVVECTKNKKNKNVSEFWDAYSEKGDRYDLNETYHVPYIMLSNFFISTDLTLKFDSSYTVNELFEAQFISELFEQTQILSIVRRKGVNCRPYEGCRPIHSFCEDFRFSHEQLRKFINDFIAGRATKAKEKYGFLPYYIQYSLLYFLKWTFTTASAEKIYEAVFSVEEYKSFLRNMLQDIDDAVINKSGFNLAHRYLIYKIKYGENYRFVMSPKNKKIYFNNTKLCDISGNNTTVNFVEIKDGKLMLHGRIKYIACNRDEHEMYVIVNGQERRNVEYIDYPFNTKVWEEDVYCGHSYRFELDLTTQDEWRIELYSTHKGTQIKRRNISFGKFSPIETSMSNSYYYSNGYVLTYSKKDSVIIVRRASKLDKIKYELRYEKELSRSKNEYARTASYVRLVYFLIKPFFRKKIWLISDRTGRADDNGEAFLKYMNTVKNKDIKYYFVIDKNCEDGKRLSKIAKLIQPNSRKHKFYHLLADAVVSSQSNDPVVNPLHRGTVYYRDILSKLKIVFLQHGVIKDDMSDWANLYNRNLYGFVVTTHPEYHSILDYNYFYTPKNVWLTGLPRHDYLYNDEKKYITFLPTWRKYLMKPSPDSLTGQWMLRDDLPKDNEFSTFYNELFHNEKLLKTAEECGYTLCFKPHPIIEPYMDRLFDFGDKVKILDSSVTFRDMYAYSNLMLTDFSSAVFDFAYLRKPIVYTHFDLKHFREGGHSYVEGYYDYERDGFGEVTYDLEETVDVIVDYMKNGCKIKDKYLERINEQFAYSDKNCCERVYKKILDRENN